MYIVEHVEGVPRGILPRFYYALDNSSGIASFHEGIELRHPLSIYSVSLSTIREKIEQVVTLIAPLYTAPKNLQGDSNRIDAAIRDATDALLDALMEHFDDCNNILKCYLDAGPDKQKMKLFALVHSNWGSYRDHIGMIVNRIKHKQRRIRTIVFWGDQWAAPGYFVEGPAGSKLIGPDPVIHPGGGTAFSFRRNLMFHLCGIYAVSRSMTGALAQLNQCFRNVAPRHVGVSEAESKWFEMIRKVESLGPLVFPDEARLANPVVKCKGDRFYVEYPAKVRPQPVSSTGTVSTSLVVDGMSPSFRLPYFKAEDRA